MGNICGREDSPVDGPRPYETPLCTRCGKTNHLPWMDLQPNQRRHWAWSAEEQKMYCRDCFRQRQEELKNRQEERDKLRLAKLVKFGDRVSKPPMLRTIESGKEWARTMSFEAAFQLSEETEIKVLVWEASRQQRSPRDGQQQDAEDDMAERVAAEMAAAELDGRTGASKGWSDDEDGSRRAKTTEQRARIGASVRSNVLFMSMPPAQYEAMLDAMFEVRMAPGEFVIRQGEEGDNFYVVESGEFEVYVAKDGGPPRCVMEITSGGTFGELALMDNTPRRASVCARTEGLLWAVGRPTFQSIMVEATLRHRKKYEPYLNDVPLLQAIDPYERSAMADCLVEVSYKDGQNIICQGEKGDAFYIVLEGQAAAVVPDTDTGKEMEVMAYKRGSYFGEVALLRNEPRKATVKAKGDAVVARMDVLAFRRLLARPLQQKLEQSMQSYSPLRATNEKFVR